MKILNEYYLFLLKNCCCRCLPKFVKRTSSTIGKKVVRLEALNESEKQIYVVDFTKFHELFGENVSQNIFKRSIERL